MMGGTKVYTETITNPELVERFNKLVHAKLEVAMELPDAVQNYTCSSSDHGHASFLLVGWEDAIKITHGSLGDRKMVFAHDERPAYNVTTADEEGLVVEFGGDRSEVPSLSDMLSLAENTPVATNELVPYGWVKDGRIVGVLYSCDIYSEEVDGRTFNLSSFDCLVLEGEPMPEQIKMEAPAPDYTARIWELIEMGWLVRLTDRIKGLPAEAWAESHGKGENWFRFEASDGELPEFVVGKRYLDWHPLDQYAGQGQGDDPKNTKAYSNPLRGWFR